MNGEHVASLWLCVCERERERERERKGEDEHSGQTGVWSPWRSLPTLVCPSVTTRVTLWPTYRGRGRGRLEGVGRWGVWGGGGGGGSGLSNSKQWFTTSFLQPAAAVFSYAIGPRKLSANEQFLVGAQTVVSLLQTAQIISDVSVLHNWPCCLRQFKLNQNRLNQSRRTHTPVFFCLFFTRGGCVSCLRACLGVRLLLQYDISIGTFRSTLTASLDSCAEIKSAPSVA